MCCPRYFQQISYFPFLISRYLMYPPTLYQSGWHVMTVLPHQHWLLPPVTNLCYTYHRVGWHSSIILSAVTDAMSNQNIIGVLSRYIYLFIVECRYGRYRYFDHWRVLQILNSVTLQGCRPQDLVTLGGVEVGGGEEVAEDVPLVLPGVVVPGPSLPQVTVPLE